MISNGFRGTGLQVVLCFLWLAFSPNGFMADLPRDAVRMKSADGTAEAVTLPVDGALIHIQLNGGSQAAGPVSAGVDGRWWVQIRPVQDPGAVELSIFGAATKRSTASPAHADEATVEIAFRKKSPHQAVVSTWVNDELLHDQVTIDDPTYYGARTGRMRRPEKDDGSTTLLTAPQEVSRALRMADDFSVATRFRTEAGGTLFAKAPASGDWQPNGRTVFVQGESLVYDIGWLGAMRARGEEPLNDGGWHTVVLAQEDGDATIYIDGLEAARRASFTRPDDPKHLFKIGNTSANFPENISPFDGRIAVTHFYERALTPEEVGTWHRNQAVNIPPKFAWSASVAEEGGDESGISGQSTIALKGSSALVDMDNSWIQPLADADHASIIRGLDDEALERGRRIYRGVCFACHGTPEEKGTLPTSRPFWKDPFMNGADPYSLYLTLKKGYGQMPPQPWLTPDQAYDVIHFIREEFVRPNNPGQYFAVDEAWLDGLPRSLGPRQLTREQEEFAKGPKYLRMDFGPVLNWTIQVAPENIAYKGIAIRLDEGRGGIGRGRSWMLYDHDTMRVAAAWTGDQFIDWKGIAFDQSHGTHASLRGDRQLVNPPGPGWADPRTGTWDDPRLRGRDGKPYGPLPREWTRFLGQYIHGSTVVLEYTVGDAHILEKPDLASGGDSPVFMRTLNVGKSGHDLTLRIGPSVLSTWVTPETGVEIIDSDGYKLLRIPSESTPVNLNLLMSRAGQPVVYTAGLAAGDPMDLSVFTRGGPTVWSERVTTPIHPGEAIGAFTADELTIPEDNPWNSWMRLGGFDFIDASTAVVATWLGDVWLVDGIDSADSRLEWQRICTGLFQPLGVKFHKGDIYVTCRDQIARLHDLNGDRQIDRIECFNNDHQVTEHFHEFAMGLQVDDDGNFYYAKSARHALKAVVPHHGTLLRVSPDGARTDIIATGFRAANGVCLNPDGTFIVTDQEGHWNPKNRINYVREGGFYGNMYGYHDVTDASDSAMEQPLCWITNAFDRSPGELMWVPDSAAWGPFNGRLLNLSYGMGKVFLVPHEIVDGQAQGGMVSLGLDFPTGIMRGRFHPLDGQLYATGMFAWAGNKHRDGGFYRIRYTGKPAALPVDLRAHSRGVDLTFSEKIDADHAADLSRHHVRVWDLVRSKNYGSPHRNERELEISEARLLSDGRTLRLIIPELRPTWGMEISVEVRSALSGETFTRVIHNSVHHQPPVSALR